MIERYFPITCNGNIIANHILIPENDYEKSVGMRGRSIDKGSLMLFEFPDFGQLEFNMIGVEYDLGIIVLNESKNIMYAGVMEAEVGKYSGYGKYVLEVHSDTVLNLGIGNRVNF